MIYNVFLHVRAKKHSPVVALEFLFFTKSFELAGGWQMLWNSPPSTGIRLQVSLKLVLAWTCAKKKYESLR